MGLFLLSMLAISGWTENYGNDVVAEAKQWQRNGTARPVKGKDGLILFPFGQYQPVLTCAPLFACEVAFENGEVIKNVVSGDTVRWIVGRAESGEGASTVQHVFVKPTEIGIQTNLSITTNRRVYVLTLRSAKGSDYVSRVGFYYPEEMVQSWQSAENKAKERAPVATMPFLTPDQLKFNYEIVGDKSLPWYPVRAFSDGTHVYIQMPDTMSSSEAPALVLMDGKSTQLVNYRVSKNYFIVDKIFERAALILGAEGQQKRVEILKYKSFFEQTWQSRSGLSGKGVYSEASQDSLFGFALQSEHVHAQGIAVKIEGEAFYHSSTKALPGHEKTVGAAKINLQLPLGQWFDLRPWALGATDAMLGPSVGFGAGLWFTSPEIDFGVSSGRDIYERSRFGSARTRNHVAATLSIKKDSFSLASTYRAVFNSDHYGSEGDFSLGYKNEDFALGASVSIGCFGASLLCKSSILNHDKETLNLSIKLADKVNFISEVSYSKGVLAVETPEKYNAASLLSVSMGGEILY